jgi:uncharacterized protein (DUF983 family)
MISEKSIFYSILLDKCPRCHQGDLFVYKNPYTKLAFRKMHAHCNVCGQASEPEPGFYQGAMYASYAVSIVVCCLVGVPLLFTAFSPESILMILSLVLIILIPWIFRVSRMIWLNLFVRYRPEVVKHLP